MNIEQIDNFVLLWKKYVKADDKNLTPEAIILKEDLIEHARYFAPFSLGGFRQGNFTVTSK